MTLIMLLLPNEFEKGVHIFSLFSKKIANNNVLKSTKKYFYKNLHENSHRTEDISNKRRTIQTKTERRKKGSVKGTLRQL